jgi:hypothetical protein
MRVEVHDDDEQVVVRDAEVGEKLLVVGRNEAQAAAGSERGVRPGGSRSRV